MNMMMDDRRGKVDDDDELVKVYKRLAHYIDTMATTSTPLL